MLFQIDTSLAFNGVNGVIVYLRPATVFFGNKLDRDLMMWEPLKQLY